MVCECDRFLVRSIFAKGSAAWDLYQAAGRVFDLPPREVWMVDSLEEAQSLLEEFWASWPQGWVFQGPKVSIDEVPCPCGRHQIIWGLITTESSERNIIVVSHRGWYPCGKKDVVVVDFRAGMPFYEHSRRGSVHAAWGVLYGIPCGVTKDVYVTLASSPQRVRAWDAFNLAMEVLGFHSK